MHPKHNNANQHVERMCVALLKMWRVSSFGFVGGPKFTENNEIFVRKSNSDADARNLLTDPSVHASNIFGHVSVAAKVVRMSVCLATVNQGDSQKNNYTIFRRRSHTAAVLSQTILTISKVTRIQNPTSSKDTTHTNTQYPQLLRV